MGDRYIEALNKVEFGLVMSEQTYGRGQVEWALWRSFVRTRIGAPAMPNKFRTRVKRLLDIDRDLDIADVEVAPSVDHAFVRPPDADGAEATYSAVDAFCLAIGLDLLDTGFKQSEVVFLLRYLRLDFEDRFPTMLREPSLIDRQRHLARHYPNLPAYEENNVRFADNRLFVIVQKIEMTEILPPSTKAKVKGPLFLEPVFCSGGRELGECLHEAMPNHRRIVTVLELAATAQAVSAFLEKAPRIRRGRPKAE